jgi:KDO2-lipid IV(A) lauroyltransferase
MAKPQQFTLSLLHPRYWLTWLGFGLWWLLAQLPYRWQLKLGHGLGWLLYRVAKRRRRIAERNIALCFPELSAQEQERLVRGTIDSTAIAVFESGMAWFWPVRRLRKLFHVVGLEHLKEAERQGQGVLLMAMHFTNLDIGAGMLCLEHSIDGVYRPHDNPVYDYVQRRGRESNNPDSKTVRRDDVRTIVKRLRSGRAIWYAPDQDYGPKHCVFVPFFGVPAATITATAQLARLGQAQVIPFVQTRLPNGRGYEIKVYPAVEGFPSGDEQADAARINAVIEARVRENPEQYMWVHRRFKTRPPGEPSFYR